MVQHRIGSISKWSVAVAVSLALVLSSSAAHAQVPSTTQDGVAGSDALRTGGCTGCFVTQMIAAVATFSNIKRSFRVCATGGTIPNDNACDGSGGGKFGDFIMLQGDLLDSSNPANGGRGVPGGATDVTYRISANGSGNGFLCSRTASPGGIGFIAPEGFDGLPNTADDAGLGGVGHFGQTGNGNDGSGGAATGGSTDTAPKMAQCTGSLSAFVGTSGTTLPTAANELCIVNVDKAPGNAAILNDQRGAAAPGAITSLGQLDPANETTNLTLTCDLGFGDLPPADFADPNTAKITLKTPDTFGAQIFKIVASKDVHAFGATLDKKLHLNDAQIENIFGTSIATNVCSLENLGAQTSSSSTVDDLHVCYRATGSGSREVFRNSFMANTAPGGSKAIGEGSPITTTACAQKRQNGTLVSPSPKKTLHRNAGAGDVVSCMENNPKAIGYVDADRDSPKYYGVVVEGVDPDVTGTVLLRDLVKCGLYRYWGPLAGGEGPRTGGALTAAETAHRAALKNQAIFSPTSAYLPLKGVAFTKANTDSFYQLQFAPAAGECPGASPAPVPIPPPLP